MKQEVIKPCPFCGKIPKKYIWSRSEVQIFCSDDFCIAGRRTYENNYSSIENAELAWNNRAKEKP